MAETKGHWIIEQDDTWQGGEVCWCSECEYGFATALNFEPFYWRYCPQWKRDGCATDRRTITVPYRA